MSTPKGYPSQEKEDRLKGEFATVTPVRQKQHGLDVVAHEFVSIVASDAVEANSTTSVINATSHVARKGDVIRITSGALSPLETVVFDTTANTITLAETLSAAPAAAVTFDILRYTRPTVTGGGGLTSALVFTRNGADQVVTEDTVTPANNRPLPVKLTDFSGDMVLNAANLNLEVQLDATGANPDSVRVSDGTNTLAPNADGSIPITDNSGSLTVDSPQLPAALGQAAMAASLPVVIASDQSAVPVSDGGGSITVDGTVAVSNFPAVQSIDDNGGSITVDGAVTVSGTVAVSSSALPTGAATEATLAAVEVDTTAIAGDTATIAGDTTSLDTKAVQQALDFGASAGGLRVAAIPGNATGTADFNSGTVSAQTLRTTPATDSPHLLATRHEAVGTPLSTRLSDGTDFLIATAIAASQFTQATVTKALQVISTIVGWDGTNHREVAVNTSGHLKTEQQSIKGKSMVDMWSNDYSSVNVTTAAYVQLDAATGADINRLHIFDSSGETLVLAIGAAASEVDQFYIPPGGIDIDINIPSGSRISIKAISANATSGEINITALS